MVALDAVDVSHAFGKAPARVEVLKSFSMTVEAGEFVALMGPSGSGKSTFLHLAAGLLSPCAGRIAIAGTDVTALGDAAAARFRRRHVGVVFQAFNLIDSLDVAENIRLPARLDHACVPASRLDELLVSLALDGKAYRRVCDLSGGEKQRVAIARALYMKPAVVLADEPTGNLDVSAAHGLCNLLGGLNAREGAAILLVTHDPVVAAAASRVCFLKEGRLAASFPTGHDAAEISRRYLELYR